MLIDHFDFNLFNLCCFFFILTLENNYIIATKVHSKVDLSTQLKLNSLFSKKLKKYYPIKRYNQKFFNNDFENLSIKIK